MAKDFVEGMAPLGKPEEKDFNISVGTDLSLPFASPYYPEFSTINPGYSETGRYEVSQYGYDIDEPSLYDLMTMRKKDPQARALQFLLTLPIRSALATADITPAEGGEKEADFVRLALFAPASSGGMVTPFRQVMAQILEALFLGFSVFEKVYHRPKSGPLKGKTTLRKLGYRPAPSITFISDGHGDFAGVRQRIYTGPTHRDVFIDPKYCFYFTAQEELRKFYGVSFFQSAYYSHDKKMKLGYIAHLAAQRSAVGTRIGKVPSGASKSQKNEFSAALANMALAQYLAVPEGFEVDVLREGGNFDFTALINYHDAQMSKSILANFFDKDQSASGGGALVNFAEPGNDMFVLMLQTIMEDIADAINQLIIPQLVDLNFSNKTKEYPQFTWGDLTAEQTESVSKMFEKLATAGQSITVTPEFMRAIEEHMNDVLGLDVDYEAVQKREDEEQAAAEEQFAAEQAPVGPDGLPLPLDENGQPLPAGPVDENGQPLPVDENGQPVLGMTPEEAEATLAELENSVGVGLGGVTPTVGEEEPAETPAKKKPEEGA